MMRYAECSSSAGSGRGEPLISTVTGRPAARTCPASSSSAARPVTGLSARCLSESADHSAQFGQRLAPGVLGGLQCCAFVLLPRQQQSPDGARVQDDHSQPVADDVMQLSRDALASSSTASCALRSCSAASWVESCSGAGARGRARVA